MHDAADALFYRLARTDYEFSVNHLKEMPVVWLQDVSAEDISQGLAPRDHGVLFYSDIHAKRELVFPFLQVALQNNGVGVYVTEHEPFDEVRDAMRRWTIPESRKSASLSMRAWWGR